MKYIHIFLLSLQDTMTSWTRSLVWLLIPLINGGFFMLFWFAAYRHNNAVLPEWDVHSIMTYYLLLIIFQALLNSHIEEKVESDIRHGNLVQYLIKPFPYYAMMYLLELPYRIIQGGFGFLFYIVAAFLYPPIRLPLLSAEKMIMAFIIVIFASFLFQTYKMVTALISFWTKDNKGLQDTSVVAILFFSGTNLPLAFMPAWLQNIANHLPFAYFIYYPIISFQGKLSTHELWNVIIIQIGWLVFFVLIYKILLYNGLKKFTAVGQ